MQSDYRSKLKSMASGQASSSAVSRNGEAPGHSTVTFPEDGVEIEPEFVFPPEFKPPTPPSSVWSGSGRSVSPSAEVGVEPSATQKEQLLQLTQAALRKAEEGFKEGDFDVFARIVRPGYTQTAPEEEVKKETFAKLVADFETPRTRELGFLKTPANKSRYLQNLEAERLILALVVWAFLLPALTLLHDFLLGPLLLLTAFSTYHTVSHKEFYIFYSVVLAIMCFRYSYVDLNSDDCKLLGIAERMNCRILVNFLKRHNVKRCCPFSGEAVKTKYFIVPQGTRNTAKLSLGCRVKEWSVTIKSKIEGRSFSAAFEDDGHVEITDGAGAFLCKRKLMQSETGPVYSFFEYFKRNEHNLVCANGDISKGVLHALSIDEVLNLIISDTELLQCETAHDILILGFEVKSLFCGRNRWAV